MYRNDSFFRRIAKSSACAELLDFIKESARDEQATLNDVAVGALTTGETAKAQVQLGRWLAMRDLMEYIESFIGARENGK
jgi:hypothetical protein